MTEINKSQNNELQNGHRLISDSISDLLILRQEAVGEQIKNYIALLTKQLKELTRLIPGMSHAHQVNFPPTLAQPVRRPALLLHHDNFQENVLSETCKNMQNGECGMHKLEN